MSNRKTLDERIEAAKAEVAQKEARVKELLQQQKKKERTDRNHRLCKRGGKVESLLPGLAKLTDEQFETFVQKTLLSGFAEKVLRQLVPAEPADGQKDDGAVTVQSGEGTAETVKTTSNPGANGNAGAAQAARVAS